MCLELFNLYHEKWYYLIIADGYFARFSYSFKVVSLNILNETLSNKNCPLEHAQKEIEVKRRRWLQKTGNN